MLPNLELCRTPAACGPRAASTQPILPFKCPFKCPKVHCGLIHELLFALRLGPVVVGGGSVTVHCQVMYLALILNGKVQNSADMSLKYFALCLLGTARIL